MTIAADYATMTAALDTYIGQVAAVLNDTEVDLADDFTNSQRDLLALSKHKAEQARALCDDITHVALSGQSL